MRDRNDKKQILKRVITLIEDFLKNKIKGKKFEKEYICLWKIIRDENISFSKSIHNTLDKLFTDVDCFVPNKKLLRELRKENKDLTNKEFSHRYYDEKKMKVYAKKAYTELKKYSK